MAEIIRNTNGSKSQRTFIYQVSGSKGKLFRRAKESTEGFEEVTLKSGATAFHRYVDGIIGKICGLKVVKDTIEYNEGGVKKSFNKNTLQVCLYDEQEQTRQIIDLDTYSKEWKLFIEKFYNADFSEKLTISFYKRASKEDKDKYYLNCYVGYADRDKDLGEAVSPPWLDKTDAPEPVKTKKGEWNWDDNDVWYEEKLADILSRYQKEVKSNYFDNIESGQKETSNTAKKEAKEVVLDDLPF